MAPRLLGRCPVRIHHTHYQLPALAEPELFWPDSSTLEAELAYQRRALSAKIAANTDAQIMGEPRLARPSVPVDTSEAAAESMKGIIGTIRQRVIAFVKSCGTYGATTEEIEAAFGLSGNTARPRLWEAENAGELVKSPDKRQNRSRRWAHVYKAI